MACLDLLRVPLNYVQCLAAGITPPLVALLQVPSLLLPSVLLPTLEEQPA
jgi:hypothetical protein